MWSVENAECGKRGVWKVRSVKTKDYDRPTRTPLVNCDRIAIAIHEGSPCRPVIIFCLQKVTKQQR